MIKKIFCVTVFLTGVTIVMAQQKTGELGDEQINVVKPYQPTLSDAIKISDAPQKDTVTVIAPELKYSVEEKKLETKYNITPIKPVRVKDENIKELYRGFIKAGYGNYNTPYGEVFYNALRSKEFDAGIAIRHLSSSGKIKGYGFPGFSENEISVFGKKFLENAVISGKIGYDRDVVHYYGFSEPPEQYSKKETLHRISVFEGSFSVASSHNDKSKIDYRAGVSFYGFSDNLEQSESEFFIGGMAGKHLSNDHYVKMDIEFNPTRSQWPGNYCPPGVVCIQIAVPEEVVTRNIVRLRPRYEFTKNNISISAGGNVTIESAYDESKWHLYPFARLKYPLIKDELSVFGELSGDLKENNLRRLNSENPFIIPNRVSSQVPLINTSNKINVMGGLEVQPDRGLMIAAWAGISRFVNDVFYINTLNTTGITTYSPVYFNNTELNIHAETQYSHAEKLGLALKADYYSYSVPDSQQAWFKPSFKLSFSGNYNIAEKIYTKVELIYTGSRPAVKDLNGESFDLKSYVDLSLGIDYRYSKLLSVFVQLNNITATRYFPWHRYPSYKLNVMGGVTYSF